MKNVTTWLVIVTVFFLPLFFLPQTFNAYELAKLVLLTCATGILLVFWVARQLVLKRFEIVITPFTLPLLLFTLAHLVSLILVSPNKIQPWFTPLSVGTIVVLFIWFIQVTNLSYKGASLTNKVILALTSATTLLSLITLVVVTNLTTSLPLADFVKLKSFTPLGSPLIFLTMAITVVTLIIAILIIPTFKEDDSLLSTIYPGKKEAISLFLGISAIIILFGLTATIYQLTTTAKPILLPYWAAWQVTLSSPKAAKGALFGFGPGNYVSFFTQAKPIALNDTSFWNLNFATSANYYWQLLTEVGMFGFTSFSFFVYRIVKSLFSAAANKVPLLVSCLLILVIILFLPGNTSLLFLLFTFAALGGSQLDSRRYLFVNSLILPLVLAILTVVFVPMVFYLTARVLAADIAFKQAVNATQKNNTPQAYESIKKSIIFNPYVDLYHLTYAQISLAIAQGLARQQNAENNATSISLLIRQAIRQAKAAVVANPSNAANWENLANIYRQIIPMADGADRWAIEVYRQAMRLDPTNPQLRVNLGGVYHSLDRFDEAINQFNLAVKLKPDFANGYYNLAAAYRGKKEFDKARFAMQQVLANLPVDSPDFERATKELKALEEKTISSEAIPVGDMLPALKTPSVSLQPTISLPEEAAPPTVSY